ncbi:MAG TPA: TetR/AcrR family transcriptional regulator [Arachnia sp.]|nr:TetR/AcrR family transcriptional regulator [Arachnia sp.]HMT86826.1 TetR/AcrR family transcriptional regulator [Arachnia sp.]
MTITRQQQRHGTVAKVIDGAGELFRRKGFADTTIRDIAAACNVSIGTVMSVGDKNALLIASFDRLIQSIHDERCVGTATSGGNCVDRVAALFDPFVDLFTGDAGLARAYASVLIAGAHDSIAFTELSNALIEEIEATLQDTTGADSHQITPVAEGLYFAYIGRLFTWSSRDDDNAAALRQSLRRIVAAICPDEERSA